MAGKKYAEVAKKVDRERLYEPRDAVALVKELATAKFDETVEIHIRTGVDPRHADQIVRGSAALPAGTGKTRRVIAFATGDKAREAEEAGADAAGGEDLVARIQGGWLDFDVAVATPEMMGMVGRLGRVLGPRGLMPGPIVVVSVTDRMYWPLAALGLARTTASMAAVRFRMMLSSSNETRPIGM